MIKIKNFGTITDENIKNTEINFIGNDKAEIRVPADMNNVNAKHINKLKSDVKNDGGDENITNINLCFDFYFDCNRHNIFNTDIEICVDSTYISAEYKKCFDSENGHSEKCNIERYITLTDNDIKNIFREKTADIVNTLKVDIM